MNLQKRDKLSTSKEATRRSVFLSTDYALGVLTALLISVLIWLLGTAFEIDYSRAELLDLFPTVLSVLIATISLYVSNFALKEQRKSRQAGTDPIILVHLGQREDAPLMVMLVISNVGTGAARNVKLIFDHDQIGPLVDSKRLITDLRALVHPFKVIPQDHLRFRS